MSTRPPQTSPGVAKNAQHPSPAGAGFLTTDEVAAMFGHTPAAITKWCRNGLRHVRLGRRLYTTVEWIQEWGEHRAETKQRTPAKRSTANSRVDWRQRMRDEGLM